MAARGGGEEAGRTGERKYAVSLFFSWLPKILEVLSLFQQCAMMPALEPTFNLTFKLVKNNNQTTSKLEETY